MIILDIEDNKAGAFLNFIRSLDFITIKNGAAAETFEELPQELQDLLLLSEKTYNQVTSYLTKK